MFHKIEYKLLIENYMTNDEYELLIKKYMDKFGISYANSKRLESAQSSRGRRHRVD